MVKYRYSRIRQNKPPTSNAKNRPIKNTTNTHKTQHEQNLSHYRAYQNKEPHTKHNTKQKTPPTMPQKRHTTPENKNRIQEHTPTKRKSPTERKNALQGITKAAHDPQTVNGCFLVTFQQLAEKVQRYN